jgi:precorrin-3B methylase
MDMTKTLAGNVTTWTRGRAALAVTLSERGTYVAVVSAGTAGILDLAEHTSAYVAMRTVAPCFRRAA